MRGFTIEHIFFDVGDTLRITTDIPEHRRRAKEQAVELLGLTEDPEAFARKINDRYEEYRNHATKDWVELSEEELWTRWLVPELDPGLVVPHAVELTFLFRQFKGYRVTVDGAMEVVQELTRRGYKLGIISNVITSRELPDWLEEDGFTPYFHPVVLSSHTGIRKPDPQIFQIALDQIPVPARQCAYIGDNADRDMGGAYHSGFGMRILVDHKGTLPRDFTEETRPHAIISGCRDLLELFPAAPQAQVPPEYLAEINT